MFRDVKLYNIYICIILTIACTLLYSNNVYSQGSNSNPIFSGSNDNPIFSDTDESRGLSARPKEKPFGSSLVKECISLCLRTIQVDEYYKSIIKPPFGTPELTQPSKCTTVCESVDEQCGDACLKERIEGDKIAIKNMLRDVRNFNGRPAPSVFDGPPSSQPACRSRDVTCPEGDNYCSLPICN